MGTHETGSVKPNQPLQLTAGGFGVYNVFRVGTGFGLSNGFRQTLAATELFSLGEWCYILKAA